MKNSLIIVLLCCISFTLHADWEITVQNKTDKDIALSNAQSLGANGHVSIAAQQTSWFKANAGNARESLVIKGEGQGSVVITNGYPTYTALISSVSSNIASLNSAIPIPFTLNAYSPNMAAAYQAKLPWAVELKTPAGPWQIDAVVVIPSNVNPQRYT